MRERIAAFDWSKTQLGSMDAWPQSLKTALDICLTSRSPILLWWGPELIELYNDAYRPVLGATKHPRALGAPGREIWPEIWDVIGPLLESVMARGESTWRENQLLILDRNGYPEETYFTYGYSPIRDESGNVGGVFSSVLEQTERVLSERRFRTLRDLAALASQAKTPEEACELSAQVLARNTSDLPFSLLYLIDKDSQSAQLAGCTGLLPDTPVSPLIVDLTARAGDHAWPLLEVFKGGHGIEVTDLAARFPDFGSGPWPVAPHTALVLPLVQSGRADVASNVTGILVAGVNARRALDDNYRGFFDLAAGHISACLGNALAYEQERKRAEALAALDRAKTEFFSNVSHEFRTPLTLMMGPAEDALRDPSTRPENRERLALIHRNALRLQKLVNALLDFSRIEAGRIEAVYEPVDLAEQTSELASNFRAAVERAGMDLVVDCPPLPQPVYVDADMWEKVVLNLLSNAFKHTFEGEIAVRLRAVPGAAELEVADTGVGIPAEQLPRIFERFHRVPSAGSRTHEGTGIGLAMVQEIVKLHGARISVASEEGKGTTFRVRVPFGSAHLPKDRIGATRQRASTALGAAPFVEEALRWLPGAEDEAAVVEESTAGAEHVRTRGARVLLADDNADMRAYVARLLGARGWRVETVADGSAALEAARRSPPDLIVTDVMMPGLDGFELLRALRADERTREIPVIMLSARAGEEATVEGLAEGADDYLTKPFSARELVARIDALLSITRARHLSETALRDEAEVVRTVERIGSVLTAERDVHRILQIVTDEATQLATAQFGAFFYNVVNAEGEALLLYTLSGAPREAFSKFPMPRNTQVFGPTFSGRGIVRSGDIRKDPRYGKNAPYHGMPKGHLPVVSYLAVPVVSNAGEVLGGLFFGHGDADVFTERHERLVTGIASWAALAIDNARLYEAERSLRQRVEQALGDARNAQAEAEHANQAKSQFLAAMSHELRTPLNVIQGHVQLVQMGIHGPLTPAQGQALERVQASQQHLLALITDVLNFAKLEAGRVEYDLVPVEIAPFLDEVVQLIEPQLVERNLDCRRELAGGVAVQADREKLRQVMLNLLSNALKFTPSGGTITISAERVPEAGQAEIRVRDTGIGIPRDRQEAIFDPFVQVHRNFTRPDAGTGLGLAISRDLARGMEGELTVQSTENQGSVFTVTLPLAG